MVQKVNKLDDAKNYGESGIDASDGFVTTEADFSLSCNVSIQPETMDSLFDQTPFVHWEQSLFDRLGKIDPQSQEYVTNSFEARETLRQIMVSKAMKTLRLIDEDEPWARTMPEILDQTHRKQGLMDNLARLELVKKLDNIALKQHLDSGVKELLSDQRIDIGALNDKEIFFLKEVVAIQNEINSITGESNIVIARKNIQLAKYARLQQMEAEANGAQVTSTRVDSADLSASESEVIAETKPGRVRGSTVWKIVAVLGSAVVLSVVATLIGAGRDRNNFELAMAKQRLQITAWSIDPDEIRMEACKEMEDAADRAEGVGEEQL